LVRMEITEAHDYDLVGRVSEIVRRAERPEPAILPHAASGSALRIATGAPLRILA